MKDAMNRNENIGVNKDPAGHKVTHGQDSYPPVSLAHATIE